jgi:hypothetical protein
MEMLALIACGLLVWWIYANKARKQLALQVMDKWISTAQVAAAADTDLAKCAALVGRSVSMSDFHYEYCGVPPMLKVALSGSGKYLGFRGEIMDDGNATVWFQPGSRRAAKKLVQTLCVMYPKLIDGNKFGAVVSEFMQRFGPK